MEWPDWRGECVAIVASGPSTIKADVEKLRDRIHVVAIKQNVDLCPWADVVYGCDPAWWRHRRGLPDFHGLKIMWGGDKDYRPFEFPGAVKISIEKKNDRLLLEKVGHVGAGGNSGFQALTLVAQFGATGILLIGFDLDDAGGVHWYGRNNWPNANNPNRDNFKRWRVAFDDAAPVLKERGVEVMNASPRSKIEGFRKMSVDEALARWGL